LEGDREYSLLKVSLCPVEARRNLQTLRSMICDVFNCLKIEQRRQ